MKYKTGFLELTSFCNFDCSFCPSSCMKRGKNHLSIEDCRSFLDQFSEEIEEEETGLIQTNVMGEPLMTPRIYEFIELILSYGFECYLITNISLLNNKTIEKLMGFNILTLVLSLQSISSSTFRYRKDPIQTSYEEYLSIIDNVIEKKYKMNSSVNIEIHVSSYDMISFLYNSKCRRRVSQT